MRATRRDGRDNGPQARRARKRANWRVGGMMALPPTSSVGIPLPAGLLRHAVGDSRHTIDERREGRRAVL
jgi:hypothetical protein